MLFLTKNGYCLLITALVVKTAPHGYHVHQAVWELHVGEAFIAVQESSDAHGILSREENDLHILLKPGCMLDNYTLACSFLPCCSAVLILSVGLGQGSGVLTQLWMLRKIPSGGSSQTSLAFRSFRSLR